jgi:phosphoribosylformimino-5-aminoimidazole carboxamide ribotide isomerase
MEVIPAIDLLEGRCVRLYQGDYEQAETFDEIRWQWRGNGLIRAHHACTSLIWMVQRQDSQ